MKKINYLGKEYEVSDDVKWVAVDYSGSIWGYEAKPTPSHRRFYISSSCQELLEKTGKVSENWESSLRQVKDIIVKENKLKVGDKVELLGNYCGFKKGQIVELYKLYADDVHLFKGDNNSYNFCDGGCGSYLKPEYYKVITPTTDKKEFKIKCVDNNRHEWCTAGSEYKVWSDDDGYLTGIDDSGEERILWNLHDQYGAIEIVDEYKSNPHADLMLKYAMIAQYDDKPWESFECDSGKGVWCDMFNTNFHTAFNYRLKPQEPKIQIGQVWTSMEGVDVEVNRCANGLVFTRISVGGLVIPWSFRLIQFLENFKRKE